MCAACLLVHGTVDDKKLSVHPEPKITVSYGVAIRSDGVQSEVKAN
jgi:hypothetical protein